MRSKPLNRANAARARLDQAPPGQPVASGPNRTNQIVTLVVVLALGVVLGLAVDRLPPVNGVAGSITDPSPGASSDSAAGPTDTSPPQATAQASDDPAVLPTDSAEPSPEPSPSPASAILEGLLPKEVDGAVLTITSALGTEALGPGPTTRGLKAAVVSLGKKPEELELGYAYDGSGQTPMTILALRLPGVEAAKLAPIVLESLFSARTPGVKTTQVTLSGTTVTKVDYGDQATNEYLLIRGDSILVIETSDEAQAASAVAAATGASTQASPQPSPSASP